MLKKHPKITIKNQKQKDFSKTYIKFAVRKIL